MRHLADKVFGQKTVCGSIGEEDKDAEIVERVQDSNCDVCRDIWDRLMMVSDAIEEHDRGES